MKIKRDSLLFSNKNKKVLPSKSKVLKSKKLKDASVMLQNPVRVTKAKLKLALSDDKFNVKNGLSILKDCNDVKVVTMAQSTFKKIKPQNSSFLMGLQNTNENKSEINAISHRAKESKNKKTKSLSNKMLTSASKSTKAVPNSQEVKNVLAPEKVSASVCGLLTLVEKRSKKEKSELLDLEEPIFMNVECIKMPICPTKQLRFKLPHPLVNELSDVLLIVQDKKGEKIHPEKAVEHFTDLLDKHNIKFIDKVLPLRQLKQEYSQFELKRKLVDQFDFILADAAIAKALPKLLGKFIMFKRKMPITVHLDRRDLKKHLEIAVSKTQMTVKSSNAWSVVQVGHTKMSADEVTANILAVSEALGQADMYPGGWANVRSLNIKTTTSPQVPFYLSLVSPNTVQTPVQRPPRLGKAVEDELSTIPDVRVKVFPDGRVMLKKVPEQEKLSDDDSNDDEILKEAEEYAKSSRTVRYSDEESSAEEDGDKEDNEDEEADNVTEAMEKKLLNKYEKSVRKRKSEEEDEVEDEEEEEEDSDEEEPVIPPVAKGKKRKTETPKKQSKSGAPTPKKQQKGASQQQQKSKDKKQTPGPISMPQRRGSRGGKKGKVSKDQRKALIKRKKAANN